MRITKIFPQAKNPNRVNVYADDEFYCGLDLAVALRLNLKPGTIITPELASQLTGEDAFEKGWAYALRCLKVAAQSRQRMEEKLSRRLVDPELVGQIMRRLEEADLINDQRMARSLIARHLATNTKSVREIRLIMRRKGLDQHTIEDTLPDLKPENQEAAIIKLATGKLARINDEDPRKQFEKTAGYLIRKGFDYAEIKRVLDQLLASRREL